MKRGGKLGPLGKLTVALLCPALFLALLETGLWIGGYGQATGFWVPKPGSTDVQANRDFGRRFFPSGLARTPEPTLLTLPKPAGVYRIFIIGGSAAMGFPEPAFSFGRVLEVLLEARYPSTDFEVVNAAMTAINSHVALPIVRDSAECEPDAFVIYLGNNEVVGPYGPGTVFGEAPPNLDLLRAAIWLRSTRLGQGFTSLLAGRPDAPANWRGMEMFVEHKIAPDDQRLQTVYSSFAANLGDMIDHAKAAGARVVLSTVAVNLRDLPPFASREGGEGAQAIYEAAKASGARMDYERARDEDLLRFRADSRINQEIRKAAAQGAALADAEEAFAAASANQAPGEEWFLEHVHFRFAGAWKLALVTAETLSENLPDSVRAGQSGGWLSQQEAAEKLAYSAWDEQRLEAQIHEMLLRPPFTLQPGNEARVGAHAQMLEDVKERARREDARALYDRALAARPEDPSLIRRFAELLAARGDAAASVAQWDRLLQRLPDEPAWLLARGAALRAAGRMLDSVADYTAALQEDPQNASAHFGLGATLQQMGESARAEAQYEEALALDPGYAEAHSNIGLMRLRDGDAAAALARFDAAIEAAPRFAPAQHNRGLALVEVGRPDEAIEAFGKSIEIDPASVDAYFHRAALRASMGRFEEAAPDFEAALQLDPQHAQAAAGMGAVWQSRWEFERSRAAYERSIESQPENPEAHFGLAKALYALKRPDEAIEQYRKAIEQRPDYVEAMNNLAIALARNGRMQEGQALLERAIKLRPDFAPARDNLARMRAMMGEP